MREARFLLRAIAATNLSQSQDKHTTYILVHTAEGSENRYSMNVQQHGTRYQGVIYRNSCKRTQDENITRRAIQHHNSLCERVLPQQQAGLPRVSSGLAPSLLSLYGLHLFHTCSTQRESRQRCSIHRDRRNFTHWLVQHYRRGFCLITGPKQGPRARSWMPCRATSRGTTTVITTRSLAA